MADEPQLKNKPEDSDFKQQRLKAWQPILTPEYVILTFASVGVIFLAVGIAVLMASNSVVEISSGAYEGSGTAGACVQGNASTSDSCLIDVAMEVPEDMEAPVYMYYHLSNFYQNHRRYVKSRSDIQLRNGDNYETEGCEPLATRSCGTGSTAGECSVYPCGLIAWSVYNDTFYEHDGYATFSASADCPYSTSCVSVTRDASVVRVPWTSSSIAWASDKDKKFIPTTTLTPPGAGTSACTATSCITMPYDQYKYFKCQDTTYTTAAGNLDSCPQDKRYANVGDEEFIVWMRTSGLPTFRKLHRIINTDLKKGDTVTFKINNVFPVSAFSGTKKIVLSTTTWIGGKNQFLGWTYIVVAILCLLLAIAFGLKQFLNPREPTTELETSLREADK